jgi:AraC-like DNA-binding protein
MLRKKIKHAQKDNVLDQYSQDLKIVTKTKQLFLRPNLSLRELSNAVGIPVDAVKQVLREKLQLTFFEFISEYKVNKAKILLTNTREDQCPISTISAQSGFNTQDSFEAIFKQHTNMSPEEYRIKYFRIEHDPSSPYEN